MAAKLTWTGGANAPVLVFHHIAGFNAAIPISRRIMELFLALSFVAASLAVAAPEPLITARAELHPRADPSILGYISTSGASELTDLRSCDFPATITQSGSYAQCCEKDEPCDFFTSCSAGNVIAGSTSVFCDSGYCNTGVIVSTAGAKDGKSFLGCWATDLGKVAFDLVQAIATTAPSSTQGSGETKSGSSAVSAGTATGSSGFESEAGSSSPTSAASTLSSSPGTAVGMARPFTGILGLIAGILAML